MSDFYSLKKINKIVFLLAKPRIAVFVGGNKTPAEEVFCHILSKYPKIKKNFLILESNFEDVKKLQFVIKNSSLPLLVITNNQNVSLEKIKFIAKENPGRGFLIANFDEEQNRELKSETPLRVLHFGFQQGSDLQATDVKNQKEINFKINYKGNIVPIWLADVLKEKIGGASSSLSAREQEKREEDYIYAVLIAAAMGEVLGLNLVEISEALKDFKIKG